jgi:hypothetical protein
VLFAKGDAADVRRTTLASRHAKASAPRQPIKVGNRVRASSVRREERPILNAPDEQGKRLDIVPTVRTARRACGTTTRPGGFAAAGARLFETMNDGR